MVPHLSNGLAVLFLDYVGLAHAKASYAAHPKFSFVDFWWLYVILVVFLLILLALDLELFHLKAQTPLGREGILWMGVSGMLALVLLSTC